MKKTITTVIGVTSLFSITVFAQTDMQQSLFDQLKQNIEKSCQNSDFLACVNISDETCQTVSNNQLKKIRTVIESNSQAIADGQFTDLLKEIQAVRNGVLEANGIQIEKANSCGKEFLTD